MGFFLRIHSIFALETNLKIQYLIICKSILRSFVSSVSEIQKTFKQLFYQNCLFFKIKVTVHLIIFTFEYQLFMHFLNLIFTVDFTLLEYVLSKYHQSMCCLNMAMIFTPLEYLLSKYDRDWGFYSTRACRISCFIVDSSWVLSCVRVDTESGQILM